MDTPGDCVFTLVDDGQPTERVVVKKADPLVLASPQLVAEWRAGTALHVQLERAEGREIVRVGTEGEGLGVVAYEIGEPPAPGDYDDPREIPAIPLRRVLGLGITGDGHIWGPDKTNGDTTMDTAEWTFVISPDNEEAASVTFAHRCGWYVSVFSETEDTASRDLTVTLRHECATSHPPTKGRAARVRAPLDRGITTWRCTSCGQEQESIENCQRCGYTVLAPLWSPTEAGE